jgi:hypothetical protein
MSKSSTRKLRSTAAILAAAGLGAGALAACEELDALQEKKTEQQSETYQQKVARVEVDLDSGGITVVKGDAGEVGVERSLQWENTKPTIREEWDGDTLRISAVCPDDNGCAVDYSLRVPQTVVVHADTDAGDISISDITNDLDLANRAGDVTVENATGKVRIQGDAGNITSHGLRSSNVDAQTKSGNITLTFVTAPSSAKAITEAGAVRISVPRDGDGGYRVQASTQDGKRDVDVDADPDSGHVLVAQVTDGDVTVDYA